MIPPSSICVIFPAHGPSHLEGASILCDASLVPRYFHSDPNFLEPSNSIPLRVLLV